MSGRVRCMLLELVSMGRTERSRRKSGRSGNDLERRRADMRECSGFNSL